MKKESSVLFKLSKEFEKICQDNKAAPLTVLQEMSSVIKNNQQFSSISNDLLVEAVKKALLKEAIQNLATVSQSDAHQQHSAVFQAYFKIISDENDSYLSSQQAYRESKVESRVRYKPALFLGALVLTASYGIRTCLLKLFSRSELSSDKADGMTSSDWVRPDYIPYADSVFVTTHERTQDVSIINHLNRYCVYAHGSSSESLHENSCEIREGDYTQHCDRDERGVYCAEPRKMTQP